MRKKYRTPVGWGSPAETSRFFQNSSDLIQQLNQAPIKKYTQATGSSFLIFVSVLSPKLHYYFT
jgi:hypothetical protein